MAKVKVFLSFEYERDAELHHNFYAQAARGDSCHEIEDHSLKEAYKPHNDKSWLKKAMDLIFRSDIVITVVGGDTHNAPVSGLPMAFFPYHNLGLFIYWFRQLVLPIRLDNR